MKYIHPFPARMAPDLALERLSEMPSGSTVLDPMIGSGTVLRMASEKGINARGFDLDPIALLISKVDTSAMSVDKFIALGEHIEKTAKKIKNKDIILPWVDDCEETSNFIEYWFAENQKNALRKLAYILKYDKTVKHRRNRDIRNALMLAMSRMIITKEPHASLARDTSRSRPHKTKDLAKDFDVIGNYEKSVSKIANLLHSRENTTPRGRVKIYKGDARNMEKMDAESMDAIITSPPYLNAIDYMRGHRLSLVWMGYSIPKLRETRTESVGAENGIIIKSHNINVGAVDEIYNRLSDINKLKPNLQKMVKRYIQDMLNVLDEAYRVLKYESKAVYVVGDSCLRGVVIKNSDIIKHAAEKAGFKMGSNKPRDIPINKRSLPFLKKDKDNTLNKRMRYEHVMTFKKSK